VRAGGDRGREHVGHPGHERRRVALARPGQLQRPAADVGGHPADGGGHRRVAGRRRGGRHGAGQEVDGEPEVGDRRGAGGAVVLPVVADGEARGVGGQGQPAAVAGRPAHGDLEAAVGGDVEPRVVEDPDRARGEGAVRGPGLDRERHVHRPARPAPDPVGAGRVDRRVVVAGVRVVAQRLAPRRDDGPEGRVGRVLLELGLDAGAQVVQHRPQALGHVDRVGEPPLGARVAVAHLAQRGQQVGEGRLAVGHGSPCRSSPGTTRV
jgi:hypothetical protein